MPFNNPIRAAIDRSILKILTIEVSKIADTARKNASWSKKIPGAIEVGKAEKIDVGYQIDIIINAKTDAGKVAAAYEFGSGIHRTKGTPNTYVISPKNVQVLAFNWDKVNESSPTGRKFLGISRTTGKALFSYVDHPGVIARPFLKPAIESQRQTFLSRILASFSEGYRASVPTVTVIYGKK